MAIYLTVESFTTALHRGRRPMQPYDERRRSRPSLRSVVTLFLAPFPPSPSLSLHLTVICHIGRSGILFSCGTHARTHLPLPLMELEVSSLRAVGIQRFLPLR